MQQHMSFASDAKQRLLSILEVLKDFVLSGQVDERCGGQIICSLSR
jgi:hypothetical protein